MSLLILLPILAILSIASVILYAVLKFIFRVNLLFLLVFPLIILFPIFLIVIGLLIDYYDTKRRVKPLKYTLYYSIFSVVLIILGYVTGIIYFVFPVVVLIFVLLIDLGIYMRRFYVNDKKRREMLKCFKIDEDDDQKNLGITYGKVRK